MLAIAIYTRSGDRGTTSISHGKRASKDDPRVEAYGSVDEANAAIGWAASLCTQAGLQEIAELLHDVQQTLFDVGTDIVWPDETPRLAAEKVTALEAAIDRFDPSPLTAFILPGGAPPAAALHLARTVCRRCERRVVHFSRQQAINVEVLRYLNRLSDLCFVLARAANRQLGVADVEVSGLGPKQADRRSPDESS